MSEDEARFSAAYLFQRDRADAAERERDVYRQCLVRIANAESGIWGRFAYDALRAGERARDSH